MGVSPLYRTEKLLESTSEGSPWNVRKLNGLHFKPKDFFFVYIDRVFDVKQLIKKDLFLFYSNWSHYSSSEILRFLPKRVTSESEVGRGMRLWRDVDEHINKEVMMVDSYHLWWWFFDDSMWIEDDMNLRSSLLYLYVHLDLFKDTSPS